MSNLAGFDKGETFGATRGITTAASAADSARQVLDSAISNGDQTEIKTATAAYRKAVGELANLTQTQALLKLRQLAAEKAKRGSMATTNHSLRSTSGAPI